MLFNAQFFALPMAIYSYTEGYRLLTNSGKPSFRRIVNPIIIAILVGCIFGLAQWKVPMAVSMVILKGAACMGPVSMLLAGITISMYPSAPLFRKKISYVVSLFRLLIIPLLLCLLLSAFCSKEIVQIVVLMYAMPCGLNCIVFPQMVGEDCQLGASMVMLSTLFCLITIPICVWVAASLLHA